MIGQYFSGIIYKYTFPNGKVYIGQTVNPVARKSQHLCESTGERNVAFWRAYKKYGTVDYEELESVEAETREELKEKLNELEIKFISEYRSNDGKYGYNLTSGGSSFLVNEEGRRHMSESRTDKIPVLQYDLDGNFVAEHQSTVDAAKAINSHAASVYACCVGYASSKIRTHKVQVVKGYTFRFRGDFDSIPSHIDIELTDNKVSVLQYTNDGIFVKEWNSITEAGLELHINESGIRQCIYRKSKSAGGFQWRRKDEFVIVPEHISVRPKDIHHMPQLTQEQKEKGKRVQMEKYGKPVVQFTLDGKYLREFRAISEAAKEIGADSATLSNILNGNKGHSAYGYQWRYLSELEDPQKGIQPYIQSFGPKTKRILQFAMDGSLVNEWSSAEEAASYYGINRNTIYIALSGRRGHNKCMGFIWKYDNRNN